MPSGPRFESKIPTLLPPGQTADLLEVSSTALRRLRPHVHTFEIVSQNPKNPDKPRPNYLFPVNYVLGLQYVLRMHDQRGYQEPAERFSRTNIARFAIQAAEGNLEMEIDAAFKHTDIINGARIGSLLSVSHPTVSDWYNNQEAPIFRQENGQLGMTEDGIRQMYKWHRPLSVPAWPESLPSIYSPDS